MADAPPWPTHVTGRGNGANPAASTAFFSTAMSQPKRLQPRCPPPRCPPPRCLKHGLFSRGVLHHGFLHHGVFIRGVFKHGAVIPALVIPAPLAFPSTARLAGWQDRLAEPSHGIGFRLPPNRCHLDAAPIPPGAIEIMAFNWLHDSRPFNPGRHGRSRAQRAGMALGNGSREQLRVPRHPIHLTAFGIAEFCIAAFNATAFNTAVFKTTVFNVTAFAGGFGGYRAECSGVFKLP
ncbi:MAG: hypothetical protein IIC64_12915 [SAR324 cluster bacterium]|nr:hypothetical protein [SAR324 cluster bacterium]